MLIYETYVTLKVDDCHIINFGLPQVQRLGNVDLLDRIAPRQIGDRARQLQNPMVRPRRQLHLTHAQRHVHSTVSQLSPDFPPSHPTYIYGCLTSATRMSELLTMPTEFAIGNHLAAYAASA